MSIVDEILYEERLFRERERNIPSVLYINHNDLALLREELGLDDLEELNQYHGMTIIADEYVDSVTLTLDEI